MIFLSTKLRLETMPIFVAMQPFPKLPYMWSVFRRREVLLLAGDLVHSNMRVATALRKSTEIHRKLEEQH